MAEFKSVYFFSLWTQGEKHSFYCLVHSFLTMHFLFVFHRGICDMSYLPLTGYNSAEGYTSLLPAVWNLSLTLLCSQHQDWLPGRHRQKSPASSQSQLIQTPCSGFFPRLMLCPSGWRLSSLLSSEAQWLKAWSELWMVLSVISINKSDSEAGGLVNRLPLICSSHFTSFLQ